MTGKEVAREMQSAGIAGRGRQRLGLVAALVALGFAGASCTTVEKQTAGEQPGESRGGVESIGVAPQRMFGDSTAWALVTELHVVGPYLVVSDGLNSPHFTVLDRMTGEVVARFGRAGAGPREFKFLGSMIPESEAPPRFWTSDRFNRRAQLWEIRGPEDVAVLHTVRYEGDRPLVHLVFTDRGLLVGGGFPDATFVETDSTGAEPFRLVGTPPFGQGAFPVPSAYSTINYYFLTADPRRERLALAYRNTSRLDTYSIDGELRASWRGPRSVPAPTATEGRDGRLQLDTRALWNAYYAVSATDQHVYATYCGCSMAEWTAGSGPRLVHVFRWDGEFIMELDVGQQVTAIAVVGDSLLYGARRDPYPMILEWQLPHP
ncbi:MAG: hypothetical protein PVH40_10040 [Gemmatimonadales bacterium]